jgi:hypothetical protein
MRSGFVEPGPPRAGARTFPAVIVESMRADSGLFGLNATVVAKLRELLRWRISFTPA